LKRRRWEITISHWHHNKNISGDGRVQWSSVSGYTITHIRCNQFNHALNNIAGAIRPLCMHIYLFSKTHLLAGTEMTTSSARH
jgi:hypothetical protein